MSWLWQPLYEAVELIVIVFLYMVLQMVLRLVIPRERLLETVFLIVLLVTVLGEVAEAFVLMQQLTTIFNAFFLAFIPVVATVLMLLQSVLSFVAWTPIVLFVLQFLMYVCDMWLLPTIVVSLVLTVATRLYPAMSFLRLAEFLRKAVFSVIAAAILALSSILTFSGLSWFTVREVVSSPIKKVIEQNVPIIGSLLVEGLSLLKNFQATTTTLAGFASMTAMLVLAFTPAVLLLVKALTLKLLGAVTEPFMDNAASQLLDDFGQALLLLCGVALLLAVGFVVIWLIIFLLVQIGTGKLL